MKKIIAATVVALVPALAHADNFASCLLDELPGVENNHSAGAAFQVCSAKYPERYEGVAQGSGRGYFSYDSGAECALDKARNTRSPNAAGMIRVACNRLYEPAQDLFEEFNIEPPAASR